MPHFRRILMAAELLVLFIVLSIAVSSQRTPPEGEPDAFLEQRLLDIQQFPQKTILGAQNQISAQSLHQWAAQTVDAHGINGIIALDAQGSPHIGYHSWDSNGFLQHAYYDGNQWHQEIVDASDYSSNISFVIDNAGHPHFSYTQERPDYIEILKYAYHDGSEWHLQVVDIGVNRYVDTGGTSMAIDAQGHPHISYLATLHF